MTASTATRDDHPHGSREPRRISARTPRLAERRPSGHWSGRSCSRSSMAASPSPPHLPSSAATATVTRMSGTIIGCGRRCICAARSTPIISSPNGVSLRFPHPQPARWPDRPAPLTPLIRVIGRDESGEVPPSPLVGSVFFAYLLMRDLTEPHSRTAFAGGYTRLCE